MKLLYHFISFHFMYNQYIPNSTYVYMPPRVFLNLNDCKITTVRRLQLLSNPLPSNSCLIHSKNELGSKFLLLCIKLTQNTSQRSNPANDCLRDAWLSCAFTCKRTRDRNYIGKVITRLRSFLFLYLLSL